MSDKVVLYYIIFIFYINGVWITVLSRKKLENFACIKVKLNSSSDGSGPKPGPSLRPVFFGRPEARRLGKGLSPGPARDRSQKPGGLKGSKNTIFFWKKCIILHLLMTKIIKSKIQIICLFFQYPGKLARPFHLFFKYFDTIYINLDKFWG